MPEPLHLERQFVVVGPELDAEIVDVSDTLWDEIDARFGDFRASSLISTFAFDEPRPTWECHPCGDEFVLLLEGDTDMVFASPSGEVRTRLSVAGQYVIVPRGWHTARPRSATRLLFFTPGEGTENREHLPWEGGTK